MRRTRKAKKACCKGHGGAGRSCAHRSGWRLHRIRDMSARSLPVLHVRGVGGGGLRCGLNLGLHFRCEVCAAVRADLSKHRAENRQGGRDAAKQPIRLASGTIAAVVAAIGEALLVTRSEAHTSELQSLM